MELYSYEGKNPEILPHRIRLDNGETRTSLNELSKEELNSLGFFGPIEVPSLEINENIQKLQWNGNEYVIVNLTEEELHQKTLENRRNINYSGFWYSLVQTNFYKKIRTLSANSSAINTICTEVISLFSDAKYGFVKVDMLQKYINIIFLNIDFTTEEINEFTFLMEENKLNLIYSVPNEEYLLTHTYHFDANNILGPSPYPSWTIVNGEWKSPVEMPNGNNIYEWDEENQKWNFLEALPPPSQP